MAARSRRYVIDESDSENESRKLLRGLEEHKDVCRGKDVRADALIAFAAALAMAGKHLEAGEPGEGEDECWVELRAEYRKLSARFAALLESAPDLPLVSRLREEHTFTGEELEIILLLAAASTGAMDSVTDVDDLQQLFPVFRRARMETARLLLPDGRLVMSGLVIIEEDEVFKRSRIVVEPKFIEAALRGTGTFSSAWNCATQEELLKKLRIVQKGVFASLENFDSYDAGDTRVRKEKRQLDRFVKLFLRGVRKEWKLAEVFSPDMDATEAAILLSLLAHAVLRNPASSFMLSDNEECCGENLARAAADDDDEVNMIVRKHLSSSSRLVTENLISVQLTGAGEMIEDDEDEIKTLNFQLTDECLAKIGVKRKSKKGGSGRKPLLRMEQLELAPEVRQSLELAVNQYACRKVLDSWQLGKTITYGRAVSMLFYGPPGVGKTAAAEAVASILKKRILVADYSKIQNCWVGETEKNISKLFAKAREDDCVLFWDEADAMFYDRETASQNWEVRDVNVLLQELEKFDGVCILSTNRNVQLDKALSRRISLKIEFRPPTRAQALSIWKKLIPQKMPLEKNIDFATLCAADLTGGEIKNVILNAARRAAARGKKAKVAMADFDWALRAEVNGKDAQGHSGRKIGF